MLLPDDLVDLYLKYAEARHVDVEKLIEAQLRRFAKLDPGDRVLVIPQKFEGALAKRLGGTALKDGDDLLVRLNRLAQITFMSYDLELSPGQLAELEARAKRQGKPVERLIHEIWLSLKDQFFYASQGGMSAPPTKAESPTDSTLETRSA